MAKLPAGITYSNNQNVDATKAAGQTTPKNPEVAKPAPTNVNNTADDARVGISTIQDTGKIKPGDSKLLEELRQAEVVRDDAASVVGIAQSTVRGCALVLENTNGELWVINNQLSDIGTAGKNLENEKGRIKGELAKAGDDLSAHTYWLNELSKIEENIKENRRDVESLKTQKANVEAAKVIAENELENANRELNAAKVGQKRAQDAVDELMERMRAEEQAANSKSAETNAQIDAQETNSAETLVTPTTKEEIIKLCEEGKITDIQRDAMIDKLDKLDKGRASIKEAVDVAVQKYINARNAVEEATTSEGREAGLVVLREAHGEIDAALANVSKDDPLVKDVERQLGWNREANAATSGADNDETLTPLELAKAINAGTLNSESKERIQMTVDFAKENGKTSEDEVIIGGYRYKIGFLEKLLKE